MFSVLVFWKKEGGVFLGGGLADGDNNFWVPRAIKNWRKHPADSGVARAFPGGWLAHPKGQNEEENK